jgi:predicted ribosome quality control (RQC) complex YloA/Tae2 family protein
MRLNIKLDMSVEENASLFYEKAKKDKKKMQGAILALSDSRDKLRKIEALGASKTHATRTKKDWYEKFRWFFTSDGFLVVGGRDATTNEIVIKKHAGPGDIVMHTDMAGSPFFVIKSDDKQVSEAAIRETSDAVACYSKAWKIGHSTAQVFYVKPEQVSKQAMPGEHLGKGAFMIYGKTNYIENKMKLAIGFKDGRVIGGPVESIISQTDKIVQIRQGDKKPSDAAKLIKKRIGGDIDDIIRFLPASSIGIP